MMHRQGSSKHQTTTMAALAIAAVLLLLQASPLTAMATPPSSIEDACRGAAEKCEDVWKGEEKAKVPVARHDREYGRMAVVALGLTSGIA